MKQNKLQIGVIGSAANLGYAKEAEKAAERLGILIADAGATLFFGADKDGDSLPTVAGRAAKRAGGLTAGVTYGKGKDLWTDELPDIILPSGLDWGGGREFVLVLACDAVIAVSGGGGTLTELAIAYQANIPIIALQGFGGWSDKLAGDYLDDRKRRLTIAASSPEEAVRLAIAEGAKWRASSTNLKSTV